MATKYCFEDFCSYNRQEVCDFIAINEIYVGEENLLDIIENKIYEVDEMKLLFLKGNARSGKDTFAQMIKDRVEKGKAPFKTVAILAYADFLKDVCRRNHNYENKSEDRDILIQIGDDMREIDPHIFARPIADIIPVYEGMGYDLVVITDLRYENEFNFTQKETKKSSYVLEIINERALVGVSEFAKMHPTENLKMKPNETFYFPKITNQSIDEILESVDEFLDRLYAKE